MTAAKTMPGDLAFGWVFLDVLLQDGSRFTVAVHGANGFTLPRRASVVVWRYYPDGKSRIWVVPGGGPQLPAINPYGGMRNEAGEIRRTDDGWVVSARGPDLRVDATVRQKTGPWRPSSLPFPLRYEAQNASFEWLILCPRGEVEGEFEINGVTEKLQGSGYIDANFGTIDLAAELDWWKWSSTELPDGSRLIASSTKWRSQPLTSRGIHISDNGVEDLDLKVVDDHLKVDLAPLALGKPAAPSAIGMVSDLPMQPLGARIDRYRRWAGDINGNSTVMALLTTVE